MATKPPTSFGVHFWYRFPRVFLWYPHGSNPPNRPVLHNVLAIVEGSLDGHAMHIVILDNGGGV